MIKFVPENSAFKGWKQDELNENNESTTLESHIPKNLEIDKLKQIHKTVKIVKKKDKEDFKMPNFKSISTTPWHKLFDSDEEEKIGEGQLLEETNQRSAYEVSTSSPEHRTDN